jgi:hypothetical protein
MKKDETKEIEPLAIRRAEVVDADKVRYRVYRSPNDFVAVIAESALMAMKVAEVSKPYRIVRDLPMSGTMIPSDRMQKPDPATQKSILRTVSVKPVDSEVFFTTLREPPPSAGQVFTPMQARDFQLSGKQKISVLSPVASMNALQAEVLTEAVEAAPPPQVIKLVPKGDTLSPEEVEQLLKS